VGADRIAANGDTANKIGTYPLAVLAQRHGVPFYVCAPTSSIDLSTPVGDDIQIEHRPPIEVTHVRGAVIAPPEPAALNREFARSHWGAAWVDDEIVAVVLEYGGLSPQPLFAMGRFDGIAAVLRDVVRPRAAYVAVLPNQLDAVGASYRVDPGVPMVRMWVDRAHFRPYPGEVRRLYPGDIGDLNRLYGLGFASWLPSSAIGEGVYYG